MFTVCILIYGNHTAYAKRCLQSILDTVSKKYVAEIRIGLNEISYSTRNVVRDFASLSPVPVHIFEHKYGKNAMKYPMMRKMFYLADHATCPIKTDYVMWFDDDSYIRTKPMFDFWKECATEIERYKPEVMGSRYCPTYSWTLQEMETIKSKQWYTGVNLETLVTFATGGWWVASMEFLRRVDYPVLELKHNGGDVLLGEILRQQGKQVHPYKLGVAINADETGRESRAKRRGVTTERPYEKQTSLKHHDFEVSVTMYGGSLRTE